MPETIIAAREDETTRIPQLIAGKGTTIPHVV